MTLLHLLHAFHFLLPFWNVSHEMNLKSFHNQIHYLDGFFAAVRRGVGSSSVGPASSGESGGDKKSFVPVSASNNSSVGRQSSSTAALPSNIAPASLPTQLAAAETSSRKQPGQTISSPQSGADNDNTGNLWFHWEDTVLLFGTVLSFDPVLLSKYEVWPFMDQF